jgi:GxxExxY protein
MLRLFGDATPDASKGRKAISTRLPTMDTINDLSSSIIGAAIEVHRALGPGLLESAYEQCLARELSLRDIPFQNQKPLPVLYKGTRLDCGYRLDFLVADMVVVELKAVDILLPIHQAQLLSYLKLGGWKLGLLINFHVPLLREGIKRIVLGLEEPPR